MASKHERPIKNPSPFSMFQNMLNEQFPGNHKKDTREEMKQEVREKKKKERDDE
jgi:hypothetical protein